MTQEFIPYFKKRLPMYRALVTKNMILRGRCVDIGVLAGGDGHPLWGDRPGLARLGYRL